MRHVQQAIVAFTADIAELINIQGILAVLADQRLQGCVLNVDPDRQILLLCPMGQEIRESVCLIVVSTITANRDLVDAMSTVHANMEPFVPGECTDGRERV